MLRIVVSPSGHPIVAESEEERRCSYHTFWSESVDQAGIALGPSTSAHHPFHCWMLRKGENYHPGYSRVRPET